MSDARCALEELLLDFFLDREVTRGDDTSQEDPLDFLWLLRPRPTFGDGAGGNSLVPLEDKCLERWLMPGESKGIPTLSILPFADIRSSFLLRPLE